MGKTLASAGIVSASVDPSEAGSELEPIQTDALITAETAGGPLVNLEGQVVGISQARGDFVGGDPRDGFRTRHSRGAWCGGSPGTFLGDGRPQHGYLGVTLDPGPTVERGRSWPSVTVGSPADEAGLAAGDRIISIDGRVVRDAQSLSRAVEMAAIGQEMTLVVEREGKKFEAKFHTRPRPDDFSPSPPDPSSRSRRPIPLDEPGSRSRLPAAAGAPIQPKSELPAALPEGPPRTERRVETPLIDRKPVPSRNEHRAERPAKGWSHDATDLDGRRSENHPRPPAADPRSRRLRGRDRRRRRLGPARCFASGRSTWSSPTCGCPT